MGSFRSGRAAVLLTSAATVGALIGIGAPTAAHAATATIKEYPVSAGISFGIGAGPDGNVWFCEDRAIAMMTPAGVVTEFPDPHVQAQGADCEVAAGADGNVWYTENGAGGGVANITPAGVITHFTAGSDGLTSGPGDLLWSTEYNFTNSKIWSTTTSGVTSQFPLPSNIVNPQEIVAGADGNLWFIAQAATTADPGCHGPCDNVIASMTPAGVFSTFVPPHEGPPAGPASLGPLQIPDLAAGPDGNIWFTEKRADKIGRLTAGGTITIFATAANSTPLGITAGPDGNLWVAEQSTNRIGRFTPAGKLIADIHVPTVQGSPRDITTGGDGNLYFTEGIGKIGVLDPNTIVPDPGPCLTVTHDTTLTTDIGPCRGEGILVTASNITLNLNGHKVRGAARHLGDFAGIHLRNVFAVKVLGGGGGFNTAPAVTGFDAGLWVDGGGGNTIQGLNVHHNQGARDFASLLGDGILLTHSFSNIVSYNMVHNNGIFDGIAVLGFGSDNNTIQHNVVQANSDLGVGGQGIGIGIIFNPYLENANPHRGGSLFSNQVLNNLVTDNSSAGISDSSSVNALIAGNTVDHNGWTNQRRTNNGIGVSHLNFAAGATKDVVRDNVVRNNYANGISLDSVKGNQVLNNTATGNGLQSGQFDLKEFNHQFYPNCGNVWSGNIFKTAFPDCAGANAAQQVSSQIILHTATTSPSTDEQALPTRHIRSDTGP